MSPLARYADLKNKNILVTGATKGIGRAIALNLATQAAHVVFNYRDHSQSEAESLVEAIQKLGGKATSLKFDLTAPTTYSDPLNSFIDSNGPITGVVHNAGITQNQFILKTKAENVDAIFDTNVKGTILLTSFLAKSLLKAPDVSIVFISSIVGLSGNSSQSVYSASKAALIGFGKSIAKELSSRNIRSNIICPGFIATDMTNALSEKLIQEYTETIPLRRVGKPEEVAELTAFLLSGASAYITGEVIKIDGGLYI